MKDYLKQVCDDYVDNPDKRDEILEHYSKQLTIVNSEFELILDEFVDEYEKEELDLLIKEFNNSRDLEEIREKLENYQALLEEIKFNVIKEETIRINNENNQLEFETGSTISLTCDIKFSDEEIKQLAEALTPHIDNMKTTFRY